ncbi:hypothetical protein TNIN_235601 [Trichonephila inaurata madagascariensis]|uniref:Uncharacterized protein n=1 Tax=Trichonephila inaurata madagascariensis TaxID=2747483 RepID=A0A8X6YIU5_9ARAC|nr:hypothetical protein TNIN_235601 [Trichonephila inaurata madagascariensis]
MQIYNIALFISDWKQPCRNHLKTEPRCRMLCLMSNALATCPSRWGTIVCQAGRPGVTRKACTMSSNLLPELHNLWTEMARVHVMRHD